MQMSYHFHFTRIYKLLCRDIGSSTLFSSYALLLVVVNPFLTPPMEDSRRPPTDEEGDSEEKKDGEQISDYLFVFMLEVPQMKHQNKKISS